MKKFVLKYSFTLSVVWALIIFGLCSMPGRHIPSFNFLELLSFDKWVHAGIFFVLANLIFFTILQRSGSTSQVFIFFTLCILYGGMLEVMQALYFSERTADWMDMLANSTGCVFALIFYRKAFGYFSKP